MNKQSPCPTESMEQQTVIAWAKMQINVYPELQLLFHIPNEAKRSYAVAARLRAEGMKSGVPDLFLPVARGDYHGMFIEMKRVRGGKVSDEQKGWLHSLQQQGYRCAVCRGAEEAIAALKRYIIRGE